MCSSALAKIIKYCMTVRRDKYGDAKNAKKGWDGNGTGIEGTDTHNHMCRSILSPSLPVRVQVPVLRWDSE